jgi:archaeosine-15-forming tRNA-guanine transglycosylase
MPFRNLLFAPEPSPESFECIPFHTLKEGERYQHTLGGRVSQVVEKDPEFMTIKRDDGWLIPCVKGSFVWDKMVAPVQK